MSCFSCGQNGHIMAGCPYAKRIAEFQRTLKPAAKPSRTTAAATRESTDNSDGDSDDEVVGAAVSTEPFDDWLTGEERSCLATTELATADPAVDAAALVAGEDSTDVPADVAANVTTGVTAGVTADATADSPDWLLSDDLRVNHSDSDSDSDCGEGETRSLERLHLRAGHTSNETIVAALRANRAPYSSSAARLEELPPVYGVVTDRQGVRTMLIPPPLTLPAAATGEGEHEPGCVCDDCRKLFADSLDMPDLVAGDSDDDDDPGDSADQQQLLGGNPNLRDPAHRSHVLHYVDDAVITAEGKGERDDADHGDSACPAVETCSAANASGEKSTIVDSGCSAPIYAGETNRLTNYREQSEQISLADTTLKSESFGRGDMGPLRNVMWVPSFSFNLVSVSQLDKSGHVSIFGGGQCTIVSPDKAREILATVAALSEDDVI
ncbi:hypothetical protein B484DRAFT_410676, partial [Ochromonadaceae sp. CCMP2298]